MEQFIFYPGFDPVDRINLKTFYPENDNIIFSFHQDNKFQKWNFDTGYDRDQCLAFLINQYTDRQSFLIRNFSTKDPIINARIGLDEIVLTHLSGAKTDPELGGVELHLFILDCINCTEVKHVWSKNARIPYPINQLKKYQ